MQLYYMALVLPEALNQEIVLFKEWMRDRFGCRVGLRSPAHITILPPYWMPPALEAGLRSDLESFAGTLAPFPVRTNGFSSFKNRTLFIDVLVDEPLRQLKEACDASFTNRPPYGLIREQRPFHPHITIATRDIPAGAFNEAWAHFRNKRFDEGWTAAALSLLRHNGRVWEVVFAAPFRDLDRE
ncbi:2'-5' RNA ligase family protein [Flaviaesturariibacter aridisoli]|uniref:2'-5' RNA ligase family protein n=1 Tax=Flaviaesturariibacter aridisoli TaxID=2545761 RepID=A0A4R4DXP1_9BACT|nr:2'-5' RNA ligase family protein [Flaviaesturariibacter aridisoli]TCZ67922.1 2'-5' RNA ligase family protein [Flaviaesturariibacter aridisoli]